MASETLDHPNPPGNQRCDYEQCQETATWLLSVYDPHGGSDDVEFLCEPHLLERISRAITWQRGFHAVLLKEEPAVILPRLPRIIVGISKTRDRRADLLEVSSEDMVTVHFVRVADQVIVHDRRPSPGVAWG